MYFCSWIPQNIKIALLYRIFLQWFFVFGYQIQPNEISVQELEKALSTILKEIKTTGAGRTDTGVHAKNVAHFGFWGRNFWKIGASTQLFLPPSIAVKRIFMVKKWFHARFDATYRTEYYISLEKNCFLKNWLGNIGENL